MHMTMQRSLQMLARDQIMQVVSVNIAIMLCCEHLYTVQVE